MGCFSPDVPSPPNYGEVTRDTLQAQIDLAPDQLLAEQQTQPGYNLLNLQSLEQTMLGMDGQRGILDLMREDILPRQQQAASEAQTFQRESDLADLQDLGPQYTQALKDVNPEQAQLVTKLTSKANEGLDGGLTPFEQRRFQQHYRAGNRGRLGNTGESGASRETFYMMDRERERDMQNRQLATQAIGLNQSVYGDPMMQVLGRTSGASSHGTALLGRGQAQNAAAGPRLFNPESPYAFDIANTHFNALAGAEIARANANAGMAAAGISAVGKMAGACWVAREVFGPANYKWLLFRVWLFTQAPSWFRRLYLRHGRRFAAWLKPRPFLKRMIRRWMESRIQPATFRLQP